MPCVTPATTLNNPIVTLVITCEVATVTTLNGAVTLVT